MEKYGHTFDGDSKFYFGTEIQKDFAFTVFASEFVINFVKNNITPRRRRYLMDGTFDSLPKGYYQLLIICIEYANDVSDRLPPVHMFVRP